MIGQDRTPTSLEEVDDSLHGRLTRTVEGDADKVSRHRDSDRAALAGSRVLQELFQKIVSVTPRDEEFERRTHVDGFPEGVTDESDQGLTSGGPDPKASRAFRTNHDQRGSGLDTGNHGRE